MTMKVSEKYWPLAITANEYIGRLAYYLLGFRAF